MLCTGHWCIRCWVFSTHWLVDSPSQNLSLIWPIQYKVERNGISFIVVWTIQRRTKWNGWCRWRSRCYKSRWRHEPIRRSRWGHSCGFRRFNFLAIHRLVYWYYILRKGSWFLMLIFMSPLLRQSPWKKWPERAYKKELNTIGKQGELIFHRIQLRLTSSSILQTGWRNFHKIFEEEKRIWRKKWTKNLQANIKY